MHTGPGKGFPIFHVAERGDHDRGQDGVPTGSRCDAAGDRPRRGRLGVGQSAVADAAAGRLARPKFDDPDRGDYERRNREFGAISARRFRRREHHDGLRRLPVYRQPVDRVACVGHHRRFFQRLDVQRQPAAPAVPELVRVAVLRARYRHAEDRTEGDAGAGGGPDGPGGARQLRGCARTWDGGSCCAPSTRVTSYSPNETQRGAQRMDAGFSFFF